MRFIVYFLLVCSFSCSKINYTPAHSPKAFIDPRDGERYGYVEIESCYWMTENMRYDVEGSKLNPNNPSPLYGRLYTWEQAMKACPEGWRLSGNLDWLELEETFISNRDTLLTMDKVRGHNVKILKSKQHWKIPGTDSLKLNILPAGNFAHYIQEGFVNLGSVAGFWTSTSDLRGGLFGKDFAYYRIITNKRKGIFYNIHDKKIHYSCRCVKNAKKSFLE